MRRLWAMACVLVVLIAGCSDAEEPLPGEVFDSASAGGQIAFAGVSDQGLLQIHLYSFSTDESVTVTDGRFTENAPALSADGRRIVFHAVEGMNVEDGNWDIYTIGIDGSGLERVTTSPQPELFPDWSPDGTRIVFERVRDDGGRDLFVVNTDGLEERQLTDRPGEDVAASWSPDGNRIAFSSDRDTEAGTCQRADDADCNIELYLINPDGSNITRITNSVGIDGFPKWSPDSTQLAFHSNRAEPPWGYDIYTINSDGTDVTQVTFDDTSESHPSWSPDGEFIVFNSDRNVYGEEPEVAMLNSQLYVCPTDGSDVGWLKHTTIDASFPDWSR